MHFTVYHKLIPPPFRGGDSPLSHLSHQEETEGGGGGGDTKKIPHKSTFLDFSPPPLTRQGPATPPTHLVLASDDKTLVFCGVNIEHRGRERRPLYGPFKLCDHK